LNHELVEFAQRVTGLERVERVELFIGQALASADGRSDVDSEWAPDEPGHLDHCQVFQSFPDRTRRFLTHLHLGVRPEQPRMVGVDGHRRYHATEPALGHEVGDSTEQTGLVLGYAFDSRHRYSRPHRRSIASRAPARSGWAMIWSIRQALKTTADRFASFPEGLLSDCV
jgi:hypothetical protein